jgi:hypothetical protein
MDPRLLHFAQLLRLIRFDRVDGASPEAIKHFRTWGGEKLLESDTNFSQARDRDRRRRLFWLYMFYFYAIAQAPPGDGTGFQWLAVTWRDLCDVLSAGVAIRRNRPLAATNNGARLRGLMAFAVVWIDLLGEFPKS